MQSSGLFVSLRVKLFQSLNRFSEKSSMGIVRRGSAEKRATQINYIRKQLENFFSPFHGGIISLTCFSWSVRVEDWFLRHFYKRLTQDVSIHTFSHHPSWMARDLSHLKQMKSIVLIVFLCFTRFLALIFFMRISLESFRNERSLGVQIDSQRVRKVMKRYWMNGRRIQTRRCKSISAHFP